MTLKSSKSLGKPKHDPNQTPPLPREDGILQAVCSPDYLEVGRGDACAVIDVL